MARVLCIRAKIPNNTGKGWGGFPPPRPPLWSTGCPVDLLVTYSSHYCSRCQKYFNIDLTDVAPPGGHYTHRVIQMAVRLVVEDGLPYRPASWHLWRDHRVFVPFATMQNWVEAGGKKGARADGRRVSGLGACDVFRLRGGR